MTYSNMWPRGEWVRRHLNWTLILFVFLTGILFVVLIGATGSEVWLLLLVPCVVGQWYLMVWNLKHKGRSLWNLLYVLIPQVGGIVFLCVSNRDQLAREKAEQSKEEADWATWHAEQEGKGKGEQEGG